MYTRLLIDELELTELLDRILDKSLLIDQVGLLSLGQTDLSNPDIQIRVVSMQMDTDSYAVLTGPSPYQRMYR